MSGCPHPPFVVVAEFVDVLSALRIVCECCATAAEAFEQPLEWTLLRLLACGCVCAMVRLQELVLVRGGRLCTESHDT